MKKEKFDKVAKGATHLEVARLFNAKAEEIKTAENISYEFDRLKWDGTGITSKISEHAKELNRIFSEATLKNYLSFTYGGPVDDGYSGELVSVRLVLDHLEECIRNLHLFLDGKEWNSEILKFKYESHS